jgi:hypothetical protein
VDEATFRILDTLSREIGSTISTNQLTFKIRQRYGTGYYARTYNKLTDLSKQGLVTITKAGRSSIPSLNLSSYRLLDLLSEIEMRKKWDFLDESRIFQPLMMEVEAYAHNDPQIVSISIINPERNTKLNRAEVLILIRNSNESSSRRIASIYRIMMDSQSKHNIRIDALLLSTDDLAELLVSDEINPLKEMLTNKITFYAPQAFWNQLASVFAKGHRIRLLGAETNPAKIPEKDLMFNLDRFGYREIGPKITEGEKICIEFIIASILIKGDARRVNAIPILLSKNTANYKLLAFLSQKYGQSGRLLGLVRAMQTIKPHRETAIMMDIMEELGAEEIKADKNAIAHVMRSYNAVR